MGTAARALPAAALPAAGLCPQRCPCPQACTIHRSALRRSRSRAIGRDSAVGPSAEHCVVVHCSIHNRWPTAPASVW